MIDDELIYRERNLSMFGISLREPDGSFRSCLDVMNDVVKFLICEKESEDRDGYLIRKYALMNDLLTPRYQYEFWDIDEPTCFTDSVGGRHEDGCGWAPDGSFCGECSNRTCKDCSVADRSTKKIERKKSMKYKKKTAVIGEVEVYDCPSCGCDPTVEATTSQMKPLGEGNIHHEVVCAACGLSAPIDVWNELSNKKWSNAKIKMTSDGVQIVFP